jgi:hypothetical protein
MKPTELVVESQSVKNDSFCGKLAIYAIHGVTKFTNWIQRSQQDQNIEKLIHKFDCEICV